MKDYYKYTREEIIHKIQNTNKTTDGYYFAKDFNQMNENKSGNILDKGYYFNRNEFKNKYIFSEKDIELYLSKDKEDLNQLIRMQSFDKKIYEVIYEFINFELNSQLPSYPFTLNELIDTTIYWFNCKY